MLSLKEGENTTGATGRLMRGLMTLMAEWEREMNAERVAEARAAKAARIKAGEHIAGRPRTAMTKENTAKVLKYREQGNSMREIARLTGLSSACVHRILSANLKGVAPYDPAVHGD